MIYDRPYMRSDFHRREISVVAWVIIITIGVFVVQHIFAVFLKEGALFNHLLGLSVPGLKKGFVWTLVTYGFLHANPLHIVVNLLGVFLIGREVLHLVGPFRWTTLYLGSIVLGGLSWTVVTVLTSPAANLPIPLLGSSAAVFSLLIVYACFQPDRPVSFLLFFVLPITVKPRHLALAALGITVFCLLFFEIPGTTGVAHSAHLGGIFAGWLYYRYLHQRTGEFGAMRPSMELPAWLRKRRVAAASKFQVNVSPPQDIRAEVDRILDKINSQGFGALTEDERRMLDEAREILNKR